MTFKKPLTFEAIVKDFLKESKRKRRLSTIIHYQKILKGYLLPFFGKMPFESIDITTLKTWKKQRRKYQKRKTKQSLSLEYQKHCYKVLRLIFHHASRRGIDNPDIQRLENFRRDPNSLPPKKELHFWSIDQFKRWNQAIDDEIASQTLKSRKLLYQGTKILVNLCFLAGLRKGEANSLQLSDLHLGRYPYLSITKSVCQKLGTPTYTITRPKNRSSVRDVPIPEELVTLLKDHIEKVLVPREFEDPFLTRGRSPRADSSLANIKNQREIKAGIPHIRIHDLRHSYVSRLINAEVAISIIAKLVGHSSPDRTYKIYSHLYPKTGQQAVEKLHQLLQKGD